MRALLQFTLDLFGADDSQGFTSKVPVTTGSRAEDTIERVAPALPLPDAAPPVAPVPQLPLVSQRPQLPQFIHPRATREARLGNARVAYEFTRVQRRTIGFVVGAEGLAVRAPRWVALRDVEAALQEKSDWILRKLEETQRRHARLEAARIEWRDCVSFPFLGEPLMVRLAPQVGAVRASASLFVVGADGAGLRTLRLAVAHAASPQQIGDAARDWLTQQARRLFIERLDHFAPLLAVCWNTLALSNAATRWGSASANGSIRLNWRLIHFRPAVIDYVVAHELSHLRVMNHSPRFWQTVGSVVPDYESLRRQLKDEAVPRW